MKQTRRAFISNVAIVGAAIPFSSNLESFLQVSSGNRFPIRLFSKPLDNYDFDFICECVAKSGIGGLTLQYDQEEK